MRKNLQYDFRVLSVLFISENPENSCFIKLEYFNEAESELNAIDNKVQNKELLDLLYSSIEEFKSKQSQAKIFYKEMLSDLDKFEDFEDYFQEY